MNNNKILITGGNGLLGHAFKKIIPNNLYPKSKELTKNLIDEFYEKDVNKK